MWIEIPPIRPFGLPLTADLIIDTPVRVLLSMTALLC